MSAFNKVHTIINPYKRYILLCYTHLKGFIVWIGKCHSFTQYKAD